MISFNRKWLKIINYTLMYFNKMSKNETKMDFKIETAQLQKNVIN